MPAVTNLDESVNAKFEALLKTMNDKFEKQVAILADLLQKSVECICQNLYKFFAQCLDSSSSPARKKKLLSNLNQFSGSFTSWVAGGSKDSEDMPLE